jgi:hypothetical protein
LTAAVEKGPAEISKEYTVKRLLVAMGLLASISVCPLLAQTVVLKGKVPFDFHVGSVDMPAGEYTVKQLGSLVSVRTAEGRPVTAMYLTSPTRAPETRRDGTMVFNRYGDDYFLTKVWIPNSTEGRALPTSKREKELISRAVTVQTASTRLERQ